MGSGILFMLMGLVCIIKPAMFRQNSSQKGSIKIIIGYIRVTGIALFAIGVYLIVARK